MKEIVLLYNIGSIDKNNRIRLTCVQMGVQMKSIEPQQYKIPLGFLAYGSKAQQDEYLISADEEQAFDVPMMVLAGFTGARMNQLLNNMRRNKSPYIGLKAMLTESNAEWDSLTLHEELTKEHEYMTKNADTKD